MNLLLINVVAWIVLIILILVVGYAIVNIILLMFGKHPGENADKEQTEVNP